MHSADVGQRRTIDRTHFYFHPAAQRNEHVHRCDGRASSYSHSLGYSTADEDGDYAARCDGRTCAA